MASSSIEIRSMTEGATLEAFAAIVAAFIPDPIARFALPSPSAYLRGVTPPARAFREADVTGRGLWSTGP